MRFRMTRYAAAGLAALLLAGIPSAALGAEPALSGGMLLTPWGSFPLPAGSVIGPVPTEAAAPIIPKEEALALVQKYFNIPEGPGRLEMELSEYGPTPVWYLTYWVEHENGSHGFGIGEVDAVTGRIRYINLGDARLRGLKKGPLGEPRSEEEARSRAWELIQALYPDKADSLQPYAPGSTYVPYSVSDAYTFCWIEHHGGIPIMPSMVVVALDRHTLDVIYLQAPFDLDLIIPDAETVITPEEALAAFKDAARPVLRYEKTYSNYRDLMDSEWELRLLYEMEIPPVLDATTGEFIDAFGTAPSQAEPQEIPAGGEPLKPASLPLTEESAVEFSRQVLELPEDPAGWNVETVLAKDDSSSLELLWSGPEGYADVQLDIETGRVTSAYKTFTRSDLFEEIPEPSPEEKEAAVQEAIRLVQRLYGDLLPDLKLDPPGGVPYHYGGMVFVHFQRYVNGIPYVSDGVNVTVDYRTGEWRDVFFTWTDEPAVPAPEGVISPEEAHEAYFKGRTVELVYYPMPDLEGIFASTEGPLELALLYQLSDPADRLVFYGIDAFTGEPVTVGISDAVMEDSQLAGHWAEGEIRFLLRQGLIEGDDVNPDRPVTRAEALNLLIGLYREFKGYWPSRDVAIPYTDVPEGGRLAQSVQHALLMDILRPESAAPLFRPDEKISRAEFAMWLVRALELGRLAESSLKTEPSFTDAAALSPTERNAVAFLEALGIVSGGGEFRGEEPLTLAEAAALLVRLVERL